MMVSQSGLLGHLRGISKGLDSAGFWDNANHRTSCLGHHRMADGGQGIRWLVSSLKQILSRVFHKPHK